jgi:Uma2 family endonuclease
VAWNMSPAPLRRHQSIVSILLRYLLPYFDGKPCEVYPAPFDVLLPEAGENDEDEVSTIVQPDISVICDKNKLTKKGCTGPPDWIIEILSPYTANKDFHIKLDLYERHGVREYWIVDPGNKFIHVYVLDDSGHYSEEPEIGMLNGLLNSFVAPGFSIELAKLFTED